MPLRTEIEKALDKRISYEEMRFQSLAIMLAEGKWPGFIATERRDDLGLDAYLPTSLATDEKAKGLACSITNTLGKIKGDIDKFHKTFKDVNVVIFSTPRKVSNELATKWAEEIGKDYNLELIVASKRTSLRI